MKRIIIATLYACLSILPLLLLLQRRLNTLQRLDHVRDPTLLLGIRELGVGASAVAARLRVTEELGDNPLGAVDTALSKAPFRLR